LLAQDCAVWLELGSAGSLAAPLEPAAPIRVTALHAGEDDMRCMLRALAELYARGVELDFAAVDAPYPRRRVSLPPYPFERERHWLDAGSQVGAGASEASNKARSSHPLITRMRLHAPPESGIAPAREHDGGEQDGVEDALDAS
jgi:acyl transferase domain-containing protein